jgi:hypothetical protein
MTSFTGNQFNSLATLVLLFNNLSSLDNNSLPVLTKLEVSSNNFTNISQLLQFRSVQIGLYDNNLIGPISGQTVDSMVQLELFINRIDSFTNNRFLNLNQLLLNYNGLTTFTGNQLPKLAHLDISNNLLTGLSNNDRNEYGALTRLIANNNLLGTFSLPVVEGGLQELRLSSNNLVSFSNKTMNLLRVLDLSNNSLLNDFSNNSFSNITNLWLNETIITDFSNN